MHEIDFAGTWGGMPNPLYPPSPYPYPALRYLLDSEGRLFPEERAELIRALEEAASWRVEEQLRRARCDCADRDIDGLL